MTGVPNGSGRSGLRWVVVVWLRYEKAIEDVEANVEHVAPLKIVCSSTSESDIRSASSQRGWRGICIASVGWLMFVKVIEGIAENCGNEGIVCEGAAERRT